MKIKNLICCLTITIVAFILSYAHAEDITKEIIVSNAWVEAMPPSQSTTAAYMVISNNSKKEAVLTSASSDISAVTEIHEMSHKNGMMHMAMVSRLSIPSGGKMTLGPDGFHIMLIDLKKPVNKGDVVMIQLHFQDGRSIRVNAQVKLPE